MRVLIYISTLHDLSEMGPLTEHLGNQFEQYTEGKDGWHEKVVYVWKLTEAYLRHIGLFDPDVASRLYIFPDSMSYGANPEGLLKFLEEASQKGSPMAKTCLELYSIGATICGAEDHNIVMSMLDIIIRFQKQGGELDIDSIKSKTEARNLAIVRNVDRIVPDECMALLLLGSEHNSILKIEELHEKFTVFTPVAE